MIAKYFIKDYMTFNAKKVLALRKKIQKTNLKIVRLLLKRKYNRWMYRSQSFLPITESISNDIIFPHGLSGVFISSGATIGEKCVIFQQVTIGSNSLKDSHSKGFPTLGKNCYIGAGAKIIGDVTVGNNVRVGANAVITKDIPDNATVIGVNEIIRHKHKLDNSFVSFKKEKME